MSNIDSSSYAAFVAALKSLPKFAIPLVAKDSVPGFELYNVLYEAQINGGVTEDLMNQAICYLSQMDQFNPLNPAETFSLICGQLENALKKALNVESLPSSCTNCKRNGISHHLAFPKNIMPSGVDSVDSVLSASTSIACCKEKECLQSQLGSFGRIMPTVRWAKSNVFQRLATIVIPDNHPLPIEILKDGTIDYHSYSLAAVIVRKRSPHKIDQYSTIYFNGNSCAEICSLTGKMSFEFDSYCRDSNVQQEFRPILLAYSKVPCEQKMISRSSLAGNVSVISLFPESIESSALRPYLYVLSRFFPHCHSESTPLCRAMNRLREELPVDLSDVKAIYKIIGGPNIQKKSNSIGPILTKLISSLSKEESRDRIDYTVGIRSIESCTNLACENLKFSRTARSDSVVLSSVHLTDRNTFEPADLNNILKIRCGMPTICKGCRATTLNSQREILTWPQNLLIVDLRFDFDQFSGQKGIAVSMNQSVVANGKAFILAAFFTKDTAGKVSAWIFDKDHWSQHSEKGSFKEDPSAILTGTSDTQSLQILIYEAVTN